MFLKLLNKVPILATTVKDWLDHFNGLYMENFEKYQIFLSDITPESQNI